MIHTRKTRLSRSRRVCKASKHSLKHGALLASSASPDQTSVHFGEFNNPEYRKRKAMVTGFNLLRSEISGKALLTRFRTQFRSFLLYHLSFLTQLKSSNLLERISTRNRTDIFSVNKFKWQGRSFLSVIGDSWWVQFFEFYSSSSVSKSLFFQQFTCHFRQIRLINMHDMIFTGLLSDKSPGLFITYFCC